MKILKEQNEYIDSPLIGKKLRNVDLFCEYLELLYFVKDRYTILFVAQRGWHKYIHPNFVMKMARLGATNNIIKKTGTYIAFFHEGYVVYEHVFKKDENIFYQNDEFGTTFTVSSSRPTGEFIVDHRLKSGITINNERIMPERAGVSIVVYDQLIGEVVDAVCFYTHKAATGVFRPLQNYNILLDRISELHAGFGYTAAQWLIDNEFSTVTLCADSQFDKLTRAVALPMKMNDSIFIKNYFTPSTQSFVLNYIYKNVFLSEIYSPLDISKIDKGEAVIYISPFLDTELKEAIEKQGGVFFHLSELLSNSVQYIRSEAIRKLTAETPGLHVVAFNMPSVVQDSSEEGKRCIDIHLSRIIKSLQAGKRNSKFVSAYIRENKDFSNKDWLEILATPEAYNDNNGYRIFRNVTGKYLNIVAGRRLTANAPDSYDNTIYIFGGCKTFGSGCADDQTIASQLQKLLNDNFLAGKTYRVENYGHFLAHHWSDYSRVILSIKPKSGDIILYKGTLSGYPNIDFRQMKLPEDYGYLFWDKVHPTVNLYRFMAEKIYAYLMDNVFFEEPPACVVYKTRQIPLCGLQRNTGSGAGLPTEYKSKLEEYQNELRKVREQCVGKIGAIVMNCNPFTLGHRYLIEHAASKVKHLVIFVVEEDKSFFPFSDRFALVKAGTQDLTNVTVIASGQFIISSLTFSDYFQKSSIQDRTIDPSQDVELFAKEIAPVLGIGVRFVGDEPLDAVTRQYNSAMQRILPYYGIECEIIPRKENGGEAISASRVRKLLKMKDFDAIAKLVPQSTLDYLRRFVCEGGTKKSKTQAVQSAVQPLCDALPAAGSMEPMRAAAVFTPRRTMFPNTIQRGILACCKPFIRLFAPLEYCTKFEYDPSDFFAGSRSWDRRLFAAFLSCFGPKPEKTPFDIQTVREFCNRMRPRTAPKIADATSTKKPTGN